LVLVFDGRKNRINENFSQGLIKQNKKESLKLSILVRDWSFTFLEKTTFCF